jgi:AGZA family xanthine/uracil permease-like MFS transporter
MMRQIPSINWRYIGDAIPAFVTVMFIPFGYSAAYGLIAGLMVYTALNGMIYITKVVSGGYIVPDDEDQREYWTSKSDLFSLRHACCPDSMFADNVTVKPHGRLPWFVTAGQAIAGRVRTSSGSKDDDMSMRSGESGWKYHDRIGSHGSNRELETVHVPALPTDPRREKVFRKMGERAHVVRG